MAEPGKDIVAIDLSMASTGLAIWKRNTVWIYVFPRNPKQIHAYEKVEIKYVIIQDVKVYIQSAWNPLTEKKEWLRFSSSTFDKQDINLRQERFAMLCQRLVELCKRHKIKTSSTRFVIEAYAHYIQYPKVFAMLSELRGILNHLFWQEYKTVPVPVNVGQIKKHFTGNGGARKWDMLERWHQLTMNGQPLSVEAEPLAVEVESDSEEAEKPLTDRVEPKEEDLLCTLFGFKYKMIRDKIWSKRSFRTTTNASSRAKQRKEEDKVPTPVQDAVDAFALACRERQRFQGIKTKKAAIKRQTKRTQSARLKTLQKATARILSNSKKLVRLKRPTLIRPLPPSPQRPLPPKQEEQEIIDLYSDDLDLSSVVSLPCSLPTLPSSSSSSSSSVSPRYSSSWSSSNSSTLSSSSLISSRKKQATGKKTRTKQLQEELQILLD